MPTIQPVPCAARKPQARLKAFAFVLPCCAARKRYLGGAEERIRVPMSVVFRMTEVATVFDRRMIGIPNCAGKSTVEIELPRGWSAATIVASRQADVGEPVLTYVSVFSAAEAAMINSCFKKQAEQNLSANLAEKDIGYDGQHLDEMAVFEAGTVDELLKAIKQEGYFSSWVIIEQCTID